MGLWLNELNARGEACFAGARFGNNDDPAPLRWNGLARHPRLRSEVHVSINKFQGRGPSSSGFVVEANTSYPLR